jgi:hypothetical protein
MKQISETPGHTYVPGLTNTPERSGRTVQLQWFSWSQQSFKIYFLASLLSLTSALGYTQTPEVNPFAPARDFVIFIEDSMVVAGKENKKNNACGGNFIMTGSSGYNTGSNGIGYYKAGFDPKVTSTYIGGTLISRAGGYMKVQGGAYIKIRNMAGLTCAQEGGKTLIYQSGTKVVQGDANQTCSNITQMGDLNIPAAFTSMRTMNACLAQKAANVTWNSAGFVDCSKNRYNYLDLTVAQLDSVWKLTTNAGQGHFLCINVKGNGTPVRLVNGGFDTKSDPVYSMINLTNVPTLYFENMQTNFKFSILAPNTNGFFDDKEQHGQLVFKNYCQTDKIYQKGDLFCGAFPCDPGGPLPVSLTEFRGNLINGNPVLNWATSNEQGIISYDIERSSDGNNYSRIGTTSAVRGSTRNSYAFTDRQPKSGFNYYRLKIHDANGRTTYSSVISLNVTVKGFTINSVSPNPFIDNFVVVISSETAEPVTIRVIDNAGREVHSQSLTTAKGVNNIGIKNLSKLSPGIYIVEVRSSGTEQRVKLMK